jgi:signal transduction histidine kinase
LRQVLEILLDNAMKYSTPQASVEVNLKRQGLHCILAVANPGEPISPENLKNIFKRFYRTDKARSTNGSYGLGLAIAERIIEEHKGKIWAESEKGINTFFVQLPLYNSMVLDKL